jgi:hypothetical protein
MIGKTVNIWIGARLPNGQVLLKKDLISDDLVPLQGNNYIPCASVVMTEDMPFRVVQSRRLADYPGAELYFAYGESAFNWTMEKLVTL